MTTREGYSSPKVPTELRYALEGLQWGAQIPSLVDREAWFKLLVEAFLINFGNTYNMKQVFSSVQMLTLPKVILKMLATNKA